VSDRVDWPAEEKLAKQRARVLPRTKPAEVTVEVWLSCYHLLFPDGRSEVTRRHNLDQLRPLRRAHGKVRMVEFTPMMAQAWALEHPTQVPFLKRAWRKAVLMQVAPVNVWRLVEMPRRTKEKRRPPTDVELARIRQECLLRARTPVSAQQLRPWPTLWPTFYDMVTVAAYTGTREGGLIRLRRPDVDLDAGRMIVTEKGAKTRTLVLCGPGLEAVRRAVEQWEREDAWMTAPRNPLLWLSPRREPLSNQLVQKAWREVRGDFPHGFHALRHYAATWLAAQGVDPLDIAIQLGHTDSQGRPYERLVRRVYDHPDPDAALARLADKVGAA
jgi:integrase